MNVEALRKMAAMGLTLAQAIEIIDCLGTRERTNNAERQARFRARRDETVTETVTEPVTSNKLVSPEGFPTPLPKPLPKTPLKGVKRVSEPTDFDEFWAAYPHRVQRRTAETAFRRALRRTSLPIILAGIDNAKRFSRKWRDGFLPNPATWLNADGWLDEHGHPSLAFSTTDPPPVLSASQIARFADHYRQTGEWKPAWGQIPEEIAA